MFTARRTQGIAWPTFDMRPVWPSHFSAVHSAISRTVSTSMAYRLCSKFETGRSFGQSSKASKTGSQFNAFLSTHLLHNAPLAVLCADPDRRKRLPALTRISYIVDIGVPPVSPQ